MARISLEEAMSRPANVDRAKLDATTEDDIRRYKAEDGYADEEPPATARTVIPPRQLRVSLGLTQREMAARLRIPFDTWRNWETGRVRLDPSVRSLLDIVAAVPDVAFQALQLGAPPPVGAPPVGASPIGAVAAIGTPAMAGGLLFSPGARPVDGYLLPASPATDEASRSSTDEAIREAEKALTKALEPSLKRKGGRVPLSR
ncbi:helix-turn-helix domain-containing protein [Methylorubrum suomiense]|uniref:HTH cro/C1-type domain-containing protein n=1 Tax=Methylorubrum suomiense TaxID=144191 RepID=A0ABQ4UYM2_9HYPH|nr:helix-turn-helix domain-containing protein [Methylorubrum suomiense]GJE77253.1 hypothetical protein BGCPKDLD_3856 [Methylorubrum suomiense]